MNIKFSSQSSIQKFLLISFLLFTSNICFAQNKVDIELKVQPASDTARGGENFAYKITVRNAGSAKASNVILIQDEPKLTTFVSYFPSKGKCEVDDNKGHVDRILRCRLEDMEVGESIIILVDTKIHNFGDVSETIDSAIKSPTSISLSISGIEPDTNENSLGSINVRAEETEENLENNRAEVYVNLLPSSNIPPRVQIISPKNEEIISRAAKKLTKITFTIKAFDPDGTVEKVTVNTQQFSISIEYPENKYVIDGKKYSIKEVEENMEVFKKYFGGEAKRIGKDTYTFTLENPRYGLNSIFVRAEDNGKRVGHAFIRLTVKGDNSIEFTKPVKDAVIQPNTDVMIETLSKLNDGKLVQLQLIGNALCCENHFMKQISQTGNIYLHQYFWKNIDKGYYNLQVILTEDTGAFTYSESLQFKVTEKPKVKITSLKQMQIFKEDEEVPIEIEAIDPDGEVKNIIIYTDGNYEKDFSWQQGGINKKGRIWRMRKGTHKIYAKVIDDMDVEAESDPITIIVK